MLQDRYDKLLWLGLLVISGSLGFFLFAGSVRESAAIDSASLDRAMEQELARQAKVTFVEKIYQPVIKLRQEGQLQSALLKLDELSVRYPGEAHGAILKGEILLEMGATDGAVSSFVAAVQRNGDYVDKHHPLSRNKEIAQLVERGLREIAPRLQAQPDNPALGEQRRQLYYLQSRLAGGCE